MASRKKLILIVLGVLAGIFAIFGVTRYLSQRTLVVNYQNIDSVSVFSTEKLDSGTSEEPIAKIDSSGEEIKLSKGKYTLQYDAKENYEDLYVEVDLVEKRQVVDLNPAYSEEYLDKLVDEEIASINSSIRQKYAHINLYEIKRGKLYANGDWYGTTLVYKGNDSFNEDTLRIILKKEGGKWVVKTDPPYIFLSKHSYPDIPEDILRAVNALPVPSFDE